MKLRFQSQGNLDLLSQSVLLLSGALLLNSCASGLDSGLSNLNSIAGGLSLCSKSFVCNGQSSSPNSVCTNPEIYLHMGEKIDPDIDSTHFDTNFQLSDDTGAKVAVKPMISVQTDMNALTDGTCPGNTNPQRTDIIVSLAADGGRLLPHTNYNLLIRGYPKDASKFDPALSGIRATHPDHTDYFVQTTVSFTTGESTGEIGNRFVTVEAASGPVLNPEDFSGLNTVFQDFIGGDYITNSLNAPFEIQFSEPVMQNAMRTVTDKTNGDVGPAPLVSTAGGPQFQGVAAFSVDSTQKIADFFASVPKIAQNPAAFADYFHSLQSINANVTLTNNRSLLRLDWIDPIPDNPPNSTFGQVLVVVVWDWNSIQDKNKGLANGFTTMILFQESGFSFGDGFSQPAPVPPMYTNPGYGYPYPYGQNPYSNYPNQYPYYPTNPNPNAVPNSFQRVRITQKTGGKL